MLKDSEKEKAESYIKILEGGIDMVGFVNTLREDRERTIEKARKEGKIEEAVRVAKSMVKEKIDIDLIEKVTGLKRSEFT